MSVELLFPSSDRFLDVVTYILVNLAAKTLIILAVMFAVAALFQRLSATGRHLIWTAALSVLVLLPALSFIVPSWNLGLFTSDRETSKLFVRSAPPEPPSPIVAPAPAPVVVSVPAPVVVTPALPPVPEPVVEISDGSDQQAVTVHSDQQAVTVHSERSDAVLEPVLPPGKVASVEPALSNDREAPRQAVIVTSGNDGGSGLNLPFLLVVGWAGGMLLVCLRLLIGWLGIRYIYRQATCVSDSDWVKTLENVRSDLGIQRPVSLFECENLQIPVTWGVLRPVILIPGQTSAWTPELRHSVIAHELAHIKRWDCLTQTIAQLACALYWFNPLVWMATKRMRIEREMACDDMVLQHGRTTASRYAQHLLDLARRIPRSLLSPAVAVAMAHPSHLEGRILSILDEKKKRWQGERKPVTVSVMAILLAMAPISALDLWERPVLAGTGKVRHETMEEMLAPVEAPAESAVDEVTDAGEAGINSVVMGPAAGPGTANPLANPVNVPVVALNLSGLGRLIPDSGVLSSVTQGVLGQSNLDLSQMELTGPDTTDIDEMIQARIFGIDAGFVRQFQAIGFNDLSMDDLVAFKIHNVQPENVRALRDLGYEPTPDDVVQATMFNVNEAFVKEMSSFGYDNLDLDDLVQLRIFNVDAAFIRKIESRFGHQQSVEKLVQARIFGLDSDGE